MKKHLLVALTVLASALALVGCKKMGPLSQEYFKCTPAVLEAKGGVVNATITGTFPQKYLKKKATVVVTPVLKYNGTQEKLTPVTFQGEAVQGNNKKISYKAGGTYTHRVQFDFKPGMEKAELFLSLQVQTSGGNYDLPEVKIADGINCTYMLAKGDNLQPAFAEDGFQHSSTSTEEADIKFLVNQANIRGSELSKDEIKALARKMKEVSAQDGSSIQAVEVSGFASPEGPQNFNSNLAERREQAANKYINDQMKKIQQNVTVDSKYTAEDWEGFQQLVSGSDIQDKELILNVLSQFSDPDQRETEIRKLSAAYTALATDILPQLRRSKMRVTLTVAGKTDDQIRAAIQSGDSLTIEEMLYAATLTSNAKEKEEIYDKAVQRFPDDWRALNNRGAARFLQGDYAAAEKDFSAVMDMNSSAKEANYNWGIIKLHNGEVKIAEQFLGKAAGIGEQLDAALGVIYLHKGDYGAANKALQGDKSNNAAIARLVNRDNAAAEQILKEVENPDNLTSYLNAIVAARKGNKVDCFNALRKAVADPELKARVLNDIEFAKFRDDAEFQSVAK
jgi:outer membrane protein OmpA-like peptidoglycan-associated protein/Tfp pilus assembly protein PilF